nr:immunoglobulin heavy chain junction region [Mus musculus]
CAITVVAEGYFDVW